MARQLAIAGRALPSPAFFPSVSSVKCHFPPVDVVEFLTNVGAPQFLVSAFDLCRCSEAERERLVGALRRVGAAGGAVLLDSGNYEKYWHRDLDWSAADLATILRQDLAPLAFSFDDQNPPSANPDAVQGVLEAVARDQQASTRLSVVPIVHGTPGNLPERTAAVALRLQPLMLAVPERELGEGVVARGTTVRQIRAAIDRVAPDCALHLLGTGNPLSILLFSVCGAGSFDGLEWCQTCVDPETARLLHFQQRELVPPMPGAPVTGLGYAPATFLHNLVFFSSWMRRVRDALASGTAAQLLVDHLPDVQRGPVSEFLNRP